MRTWKWSLPVEAAFVGALVSLAACGKGATQAPKTVTSALVPVPAVASEAVATFDAGAGAHNAEDAGHAPQAAASPNELPEVLRGSWKAKDKQSACELMVAGKSLLLSNCKSSHENGTTNILEVFHDSEEAEVIPKDLQGVWKASAKDYGYGCQLVIGRRSVAKGQCNKTESAHFVPVTAVGAKAEGRTPAEMPQDFVGAWRGGEHKCVLYVFKNSMSLTQCEQYGSISEKTLVLNSVQADAPLYTISATSATHAEVSFGAAFVRKGPNLQISSVSRKSSGYLEGSYVPDTSGAIPTAQYLLQGGGGLR